LPGRLLSVFATPGDVFDELKVRRPAAANWLVPVLLGCVMGIVYCLVVFSNDAVIHSLQELQEQTLRGKLQKKVDAGQMTREQVDGAVAMAQRFSEPTLMKVAGSVGVVVASFGSVFLVGLLIWLVGTRVFKAHFEFMTAVEAAALAGMIGLLGTLIRMLLALVTGNMAMTPGPVLLVRDFNPADRVHLVLAQLNVTTLWYLAVVALGLSKLGGASYGKAAGWVFGVWTVVVLGWTLAGLGG
jgi:hypothetical protein